MDEAGFNLVVWSDDMAVDGDAIDASRQHLIALINRLYGVMNRGAAHELISDVLCDLADYAGNGFLEEEKAMALSQHPDRDRHVLEHWSFIETLTVFTADFERGELLVSEVLRFLIRWTGTHLKTRDPLIGAYLSRRRRGAAGSQAA
ncbi:MAG: hemerythrin domain-containing protein [Rhodospirillaceae bacterium]